jgi:CelD/BcsL family acetyltransferase involved in cellulose biosynthesis
MCVYIMGCFFSSPRQDYTDYRLDTLDIIFQTPDWVHADSDTESSALFVVEGRAVPNQI